MTKPPTPTPELEAEIERLLGHTEALLDRDHGAHHAVRALPASHRTIIAALGAALAVFTVYQLARRSDFDAIPAWQVLLAIVTYAIPLGSLVWLFLSPLYRVEARPEHARMLIGTSFVLPFVWAILPPLAHPGPSPTRHGCLLLGLAIGSLFVGLLHALNRVSDSDPRSVAMGAAAGGLIANLALTFYCPETRLLHLAIAHAPLGVVLLLVYQRLARRFAH